MIVFGVDVATSSGWALVEGGRGQPKLLSYGQVASTAQQIAGLVEVVRPMEIELAVLEEPYVDKNPATTIKLARMVGRWEQELERARIRVCTAKAASWQQQLLARFGVSRGTPRRQCKIAAMKWAALVYGVAVKEDEADAICMATWQAKLEHLRQLSAD